MSRVAVEQSLAGPINSVATESTSLPEEQKTVHDVEAASEKDKNVDSDPKDVEQAIGVTKIEALCECKGRELS